MIFIQSHILRLQMGSTTFNILFYFILSIRRVSAKRPLGPNLCRLVKKKKSVIHGHLLSRYDQVPFWIFSLKTTFVAFARLQGPFCTTVTNCRILYNLCYLYHFKRRSFPKHLCRLGEWRMILETQQQKFRQIWIIQSRDMIFQRFH